MPGPRGRRARVDGHLRVQSRFPRDDARADAADAQSKHDFGRDVIPRPSRRGACLRTRSRTSRRRRSATGATSAPSTPITGEHGAHLRRPELNLYDEAWPIWTYQEQVPRAKFILDDDGRRGLAINSMVAGGCIVSGAMVRESLLFSNVMVDEQHGSAPLRRAAARRDRAQLLHRERDHRRVLRHSARDGRSGATARRTSGTFT